MALRSIPAVAAYARRIRELCPDAWLMNFTNPAGLVTQALTEEFPDLRIVGICDTPISLWRDVAGAFGRRAEETPITFFGLNHLSWMSEAWVDGENVVQRVVTDERIRNKIDELSMFEPGLLRIIGLIPNEYLYYYYYRERALANMRSASETRGEQVRRLGESLMHDLAEINPARNPGRAWARYATYQGGRHGTYMAMETGRPVWPEAEAHAAASAGPSVEEGEGYAGVALDILSASATGEAAALVANVPNRGAIPGMRDDDVLEVVCRCDADGLQPAPVGEIPEEPLLLMQQVKRYERLTTEAVRKRSRDVATEALMAHPLVGSYSLARSLVDAYLEEYREIVGEWR
jgi:6-phospho-beta-glucosidase